MSKRLSLTLIVLLWVIWFPLLWSCAALRSPAPRRGPVSGGVIPIGFFEPGGYIRFDIRTGVSSIEGYYRATVRIEPVLSESLGERGIAWAPVQSESDSNWPWGERIRKLGTIQKKEIVIHNVVLEIPDDPSLFGEKIPLALTVDLIYPDTTGYQTFGDFEKHISRLIEVSIGNWGTPLPALGRIVGYRPESRLWVLAMLVWLFGIAPVYIIAAEKVK